MNKSPSLRRFLAALALLAAASVAAQTPSKQPVPKLSFQYRENTAKAAAGKANPHLPELVVQVELEDGWHINSEAPLDSFLVPTSLEISADGMEFGKPAYPQPLLQHSDVMGGDVSLYTGVFDIRVPAKRPGPSGNPDPKGSWPRTRVTLHYQACNNNMCLPPKTVSVER